MNAVKRLFVYAIVILLQYGCTPDERWIENNIVAADQHMQNGEYNSAVEIYDRILAKSPDYPPANYGKGAALLGLYQRGGMEEPPPRNSDFMPYLKKAADDVPENVQYAVTYALVASQLEGCQTALEYFGRHRNRLDQTVAGAPNFGVYYSYVKCLLEEGDKEMALHVAKEYENKVKLKISRKNGSKEIEAISDLIRENDK